MYRASEVRLNHANLININIHHFLCQIKSVAMTGCEGAGEQAVARLRGLRRQRGRPSLCILCANLTFF